ncbi:MAG: ABC transporter permease [Vicinamibacterales bacterium]
MRRVPGSQGPRVPGGFIERLAAACVPAGEREFVLGDLEEQAARRLREAGRVRARLWVVRQVAALAWHRATGWRHRGAVTSRKGDSLMRQILQDLRHATRLLVRQPSYALVAILSLALAIGANGLVYGLVDSLVLNPFAFPDPDRLVSVGSAFPRLNEPEGFIEQHSPAEVADVRRAATLRNLTAFDIGNRAVSNGTQADRVLTALLMDDPFPALGRPPALGRGFTAAELAPGGPPVAIISHRVWRDLYGADPAIVGRVVPVNSEPRQIVGVMDAGTSLLGTDLWVPWGLDPGQVPRNRRQFTMVARLAPDATLAEANAELRAIAGRVTSDFAGAFPEYQGWRLRVVPWAEAVTGQARGLVGLLLVAGAFVLLVACANLSSLMLARLSARRREIAVRYALGAGGWQVTRLLLVESLILAATAGALGIALARVTMSAIPSLLPRQVLSAISAPSMNLRAIAYSLAVALGAALLTTLMPAWQARRAHPQAALREAATGGPGGRQRLRRALVVAELTLAVVLLVGAGQMLSSFARLQRADPGFRMDGVATMRLTLAWERYGQDDAATRFFDALVDRIGALPGVTAAAAAAQFPPAESFRTRFRVAGVPAEGEAIPTAFVNPITPDYFDVLGIPLRHGRGLTAADRAGAPEVAVVNEAFMRRYLDGRPEGRLLVGNGETPVEIVGVVADARNASLLRPAEPEIFGTIDQVGQSNQYFLLVRTTGAPGAIVGSVRRVLAEMDPDQPLYLVQSMEDAVAGVLFPQRVALVLVGVFAIGAVVISAIGVYGVVAFYVASRRREIGIRMALGATARGVTRLVVGHTAWLLVTGAGLGLAGGVAAARAAGALLYESPAVDPLAIAGVAGVLLVVGLLASWLPARRAMHLDPARVLRND